MSGPLRWWDEIGWNWSFHLGRHWKYWVFKAPMGHLLAQVAWVLGGCNVKQSKQEKRGKVPGSKGKKPC